MPRISVFPLSPILSGSWSRPLPLALLLALLAVAAACGSGDSGLSKLGDPLVLPVGGSIEVDTGDENVLVQFMSLDGDSRCPSGVQCIVAGEANITLAITLEDGGRRAFPVVVPPGGSVRSEVAGYALTLDSLFPDPPPQSVDVNIYRAELTLTRP